MLCKWGRLLGAPRRALARPPSTNERPSHAHHAQLSFDYSAFTNSGLAPCSERACSIGPLADSATFVNYMSVVQELAIARLPVHLGTPGVGDAPAADDAAWLQEVRTMFPDPRALRAADADMQGGEGRSASSRLRSSSRQHPLLPAQQ